MIEHFPNPIAMASARCFHLLSANCVQLLRTGAEVPSVRRCIIEQKLGAVKFRWRGRVSVRDDAHKLLFLVSLLLQSDAEQCLLLGLRMWQFRH